MEVNGNPTEKLTAKQERAIKALLSEPTTKAAAEKAGIGETTLHRWLNDPAFSSAFREARGRLLETTLTRLQQVSGKAVDTLETVMTDETAKGSERVSAAKAVLEITLKAREVLETEDRLRALEAKIDAMQPGRRR